MLLLSYSDKAACIFSLVELNSFSLICCTPQQPQVSLVLCKFCPFYTLCSCLGSAPRWTVSIWWWPAAGSVLLHDSVGLIELRLTDVWSLGYPSQAFSLCQGLVIPGTAFPKACNSALQMVWPCSRILGPALWFSLLAINSTMQFFFPTTNSFYLIGIAGL